MGYSSYSTSNAHSTRSAKSTFTNSVDMNFKQNLKRESHSTMSAKGIVLREARDSEAHPNAYPIIIALDLTGSMQDIPQNLIRDGLPKLISGIIQGGIQSPSLLFLGVGDHECDTDPLQVGQFESGDEELDQWLERTYLEGGGGGNEGESYGLAHYFAARHTATDHWDKRSQKGILITIGDEPNLATYPSAALQQIMGNKDISASTDVKLLEAAQEKWEVFHINPRGNQDWRNTNGYWGQLLGQRFIKLDTYTEIPDTVKKLVLKYGLKSLNEPDPPSEYTHPELDGTNDSDEPEETIL